MSEQDELVPVIVVAERLGMLKQSVFKILTRLGIDPEKRRAPDRRNQLVSHIRASDMERVLAYCEERSLESGPDVPNLAQEQDVGYFYLIQLEPDHDPGRFKLGFTVSMGERLRSHRCSAPFAQVVKRWPCRRRWETTVIDCTTVGCERLHTEVFRAPDLAEVVSRADRFFGLMPLDSIESEESELA